MKLITISLDDEAYKIIKKEEKIKKEKDGYFNQSKFIENLIKKSQ
jgi:hypothetical protein